MNDEPRAAAARPIWHHARMQTDAFLATLTAALDALPPGALLVSYSGGMDSSALLHALAQLPAARARGVRAVHIDHGLHQDSTAWAQHCREFARRLGIALDIATVVVAPTAGHGLEDAARRARYTALQAALHDGEFLALAHHREDQAETILLKLLRGAGPEGLGGMRTLRQCGKGYLWRPLLGTPRALLLDYAQAHDLRWIEDPSNADTRLARNFLRADILPRLKSHWPEASAGLAHSAVWAQQAADFIQTHATQALAELCGPQPATLRWRAWLDLPDALRDPVLRLWLRDLRLDEPAHFHVAQLERQLRSAAADRNPCVCWAGTEVRRYRDLLYATRRRDALPNEWRSAWNGGALRLPDGGSLALRDANEQDVASADLEVRLRRGGETLRPAGKPHRRELRLLLQEAGIPPWLRPHVPLIFERDVLIAAGDLILSDRAHALCAQLDGRIVWRRGREASTLADD
jgi:tRNA(Ile)-lysidine synthase